MVEPFYLSSVFFYLYQLQIPVLPSWRWEGMGVQFMPLRVSIKNDGLELGVILLVTTYVACVLPGDHHYNVPYAMDSELAGIFLD